ncbi:hypothetical protein, partial [Roseibium sp. RKSG952]|uniref:hypothetical protein n=1 Tax=Roseibium sp. RKSG952 TaxID=2529384 RepID=UPI001AD8EEED
RPGSEFATEPPVYLGILCDTIKRQSIRTVMFQKIKRCRHHRFRDYLASAFRPLLRGYPQVRACGFLLRFAVC